MPRRLLSKKELSGPVPKKAMSLPGLTMVMLMLIMGISLTEPEVVAYASQPDATLYTSQQQAVKNQTDRWHVSADGTWFLFNQARTADVTNSWFQDLDGSWYLLAPGDGHMYAGLIHDTITNKWYFCQTEHDGWYGRMAYTDGAYTVNGQTVYLTFNQQHDGTFGAITSGLDSIRSTGVITQDVAGIPEDSASATEAPQQQSQPQTSTNNNYFDSNRIPGTHSIFDGWTQEQLDELDRENAEAGGGSMQGVTVY